MDDSQVELVKPKALTVNLPSVGAPVAVRTESDEVVILVRLTLRPRDNVVDVHLDVSTGGSGASVSGLDQDAASDVSRYWRAPVSV